jgi:hypothetical protein
MLALEKMALSNVGPVDEAVRCTSDCMALLPELAVELPLPVTLTSAARGVTDPELICEHVKAAVTGG